MVTTIDTSTTSIPTGYHNARKVDRCQNGILWTMFDSGAATEFWYSNDNGASFTQDATTRERYPSSMFIDLDDYCHLLYVDVADGLTKYRRGTPNAGRTAWTWSAAHDISAGSPDRLYGDVVAHREGTGWVVHTVVSVVQGGVSNYAVYKPITITSGGVITVGAQVIIGGSYGVGMDTFPSIDFHHTGDGKTVSGSTPHLYTAWSAGGRGSGSGYGIRFKKATYSAGAWTWGTEREIDSSRDCPNLSFWLNCLFDGTRAMIGGFITDNGANHDLMLYERDAADTTTTTRTLLNNPATADMMAYGCMSYDSVGNLYMLGMHSDEGSPNNDLVYRKWTRATTTLETEVVVDANVGAPYTSAKRGYSGARIEFIYVDGNVSPFPVKYDSVVLNSTPNPPTLTAPANGATVDMAATPTVSWTFSDPDGGDVQTAYYLRRKISGAPSYEYWNAGTGAWQGTEVKNSTASGSIVFVAGKWTSGVTYNWSIATEDALGAKGAYASDFTVVSGNPPTVVALTPTGTVTTTTRPPVTWSFSDPESDPQVTYQVKIESGAYGTTPGSGTAVHDSTELTGALIRLYTPTVDLANGTTYRAFVRSSQGGGQYSSWSYVTFTLSLNPPAVPTVVATADPSNARVALLIQARDNKLTENAASLETDTAGWLANVNCSITRSLTQALSGVASLRLSSTAGGTMSAKTDPVTTYAVTALQTYTALASFRAGVSARTCQVGINWYTAASAFISQSLGASVTDGTGGWIQGFVTAAAPATAAYAIVIVQVNTTGGAAELHYVDQISLAPGSLTAWTRGGLAGTAVGYVERSLDGVTDWEVVRGGDAVILPTATQQATLYDYEAPTMVPVYYRATAKATV